MIIRPGRLIDIYILEFADPWSWCSECPLRQGFADIKAGGMGSVDTKSLVISPEPRLIESSQWLPSPSLLQRYLLCVKVPPSSWTRTLSVKLSGIFLPPFLPITDCYVFTTLSGCSVLLSGLHRWWMLKHKLRNLPSTIKMTEEDYAVWMQNYITIVVSFLLSMGGKSCLVLKNNIKNMII